MMHPSHFRQQTQDTVDHYYGAGNYQRAGDQPQQHRLLQQRMGTLERNKQSQYHPHSGSGGGGEGMTTIDSYHPPPPLVPVTDQPGTTTNTTNSSSAPAHFQHLPFDRTAGFGPKTLESLAERVHPFSYGQLPASGQHGTRASTLDRRTGPSRTGGQSGGGGGTTMSLMRGGRLTRSGSDQRLPMVEQNSNSEFYEYVLSGGRSKSGAGHYGGPSSGRQSAMAGSSGGGGGLDAATRLGLTHRRRTSIDYASDTEASTRSYSAAGHNSRGRTYGNMAEGASGSWKAPPPLLGMTPTTPTSLNFHPQQQAPLDSRSNSLPRGGTRFRREVHFDQSSYATPSRPVPPSPLQVHHPIQLDSQDDSDGAVSAPELSEKQKQLQRLTQEHQRLLYGRSMGSAGGPGSSSTMMAPSGGGGPTGNFTSAEYKAWMQRAPSTSAIYERLRQSREAIEAHRAAKLTFSAENLVEKSKQVTLAPSLGRPRTTSNFSIPVSKELPYYAYRSHLTAGLKDESNDQSMSSLLAGMGGSSGTRSGTELHLQQNDPLRGGSIPQPTPGSSSSAAAAAAASARPNDPRFKQLDINPAGISPPVTTESHPM